MDTRTGLVTRGGIRAVLVVSVVVAFAFAACSSDSSRTATVQRNSDERRSPVATTDNSVTALGAVDRGSKTAGSPTTTTYRAARAWVDADADIAHRICLIDTDDEPLLQVGVKLQNRGATKADYRATLHFTGDGIAPTTLVVEKLGVGAGEYRLAAYPHNLLPTGNLRCEFSLSRAPSA